MGLRCYTAFSAKEVVQAQRAAQRGADTDVDSARQQLAAAQLELEAAMQEQKALVSMSNQVHPRLPGIDHTCLNRQGAYSFASAHA